MQLTVSPLAIVSRLLAVLLVSVPLVYLSQVVDTMEQEEIERFSHQELLSYMREGYEQSFVERYLLTAVMLLVMVGAVETLAFLIRLGVEFARGGSPVSPDQRPASVRKPGLTL